MRTASPAGRSRPAWSCAGSFRAPHLRRARGSTCSGRLLRGFLCGSPCGLLARWLARGRLVGDRPEAVAVGGRAGHRPARRRGLRGPEPRCWSTRHRNQAGATALATGASASAFGPYRAIFAACVASVRCRHSVQHRSRGSLGSGVVEPLPGKQMVDESAHEEGPPFGGRGTAKPDRCSSVLR